ncbi:hypothetical protein LXL04_022353 [Taraxacum kok-saghyz]
MAPRRRKQPGLTRMDAALDQVSCMGFSRQLIRRTVKNLLKVYGDDGWKLIEEDGYRVVLDFILDEQESAEKQKLLTHNESSQKEKTGKELAMAEINEVTTKDASLTIHTDITMDKTTLSSTLQDDHSIDNINTQCSENAPLTTTPADVAHTPGCSRKPSCGWISDDDNVETSYKRKPCYGWISDHDDDDDDDDDEKTNFMTLTPAR